MTATLAAVTAASVLIWTAWNYGPSLNETSTRLQTAKWEMNPNSAGATYSSVYGTKVAPISVGFVTPTKAEAEQGLVVATLTNVGTQTVQPDDVVGLLSFQQGENPDILVGSTWATFVDPPKQPLNPGETATWTFRPIGVPTDGQNQFRGEPKLIFIQRGFVDPAQADISWQKAPVTIPHLTVQPHSVWAAGRSFVVNATVRNNSDTPLHLDQMMAVIWASNNRTGEEWTAADAVRFLHRVVPVTAGTVLQPGATTTLQFGLIGPPSLDLAKTPIHVSLIWR